jgi:hypothetical protein
VRGEVTGPWATTPEDRRLSWVTQWFPQGFVAPVENLDELVGAGPDVSLHNTVDVLRAVVHDHVGEIAVHLLPAGRWVCLQIETGHHRTAHMSDITGMPRKLRALNDLPGRLTRRARDVRPLHETGHAGHRSRR